MRATSSNLLAPTTSLSPSCPIRVWRFFPFHSASSSTRKFHRTDLLGKIVRNFLQFRTYHFQVDRSRRISSLAWFHPDEKLKNSQRRYFDSFVCFPPRYEIKGKNKKKKILFIFPSGSRHSFIPARNLSKLVFSRKPDFSTTQRPIESRTWNSR